MIYFHLLLLSLLQGITEFLPVSSSAHLILLPIVAGWEDQGLIYDIAAHAGSLIAIIVYFRKDLQKISCAWCQSLAGGNLDTHARLAWSVIIATLPILLVGFILFEVVATSFRNPVLIATTTIIFGLLLWFADSKSRKIHAIDTLSYKQALLIGLAQILALIPGTSRSGITMTAGLLLGFSREAAVRFSFYLSIPTILLAVIHTLYQYGNNISEFSPMAFVFVMCLSAISAGITIHLFLRFIEKIGMLPFVIYRVLLGVLLLYFFI